MGLGGGAMCARVAVGDQNLDIPAGSEDPRFSGPIGAALSNGVGADEVAENCLRF